MIMDQFIERTSSSLVRDTLLLEDDELTLAKAVAIASQVESAAHCATNISVAQIHASSAVQAVQQSQCSDCSCHSDSNMTASVQLMRPQARQQCANWGSNRHNSHVPDCRRNQKLYHFVKWCRSAPVPRAQKLTSHGHIPCCH
jgi:hypothetical protein